MALALYRKYRPRTFAEVIGQEHVTEPLSQALRTGRLHHAYLFSGPRGCGKTSSARILARSLNCAQGPTPEPCGKCDSCVSLSSSDGSGSIDVIEIDAASHGGVDDARELRERAFFAPVSSPYKIYVIDEAHMVSSAGFNALLKLVEEPPDYVKFIFATTEPEKVLGTIKSRTHHYPFRLIPPGILRPYIERLCKEEGVAVEPPVFPLVVRAGGGSARDTLSVLDQLISGAGDEGVSYARAVALLGVTDAALIDEMCDALAAGDGAAAYATIDRVSEAGHDPRRFASDLLERLRDLIVLQQVPDATTKGLIDAPADQLDRMAAQAQRMGPATLSRCADIVHNGLVDMRGTTAPRLLLELICARMLLPGAEDSTGALLQRLERMERRLTLSGDPAPPATTGSGDLATDQGVRTQHAPPAVSSAPVSSAPAVARQRSAPPASGPPSSAPPSQSPAETGSVEVQVEGATAAATETRGTQTRGADGGSAEAGTARSADPQRAGAAPGELDAAAVRRVWDEVLNMVNRKKKVVAAWAREATVRELDGETLVLVFRHQFHARSLTAQPEALIEALHEVLGGRWQVRCEFAGDQGPGGGGQSFPGPGPTGPARGPSGGPARGSSGSPTGGSPTGGSPTGGGAAGGGAAGGGAAGGPSGGGPDRAGGGGQDGAAGEGPAGRARGGAAAPSAPGGGDADWPEPARLGGTATAVAETEVAETEVAETEVAGDRAAEDGWPAAAQPAGGAEGTAIGGATPTGDTRTGDTPTAHLGAGDSIAMSAPNVHRPVEAARTNGGPAARPASGQGNSAARQAARDAASGRSGASARGGRASGEGNGAQRGTADGDMWAGRAADTEPPYDPEYDGPVRGAGAAVAYEGFDPGDEPLDEVIDEQAARQTVEQQALQLLQQALGAEKIGEVDHA